MSKYKVFSATLEGKPRVELHDAMQLTGSEVSINNLPAGASVPFLHSHVQNEELYYFAKGKGELSIDGEIVPVESGVWVRIDPECKRGLHANKDLTYICIQTKKDSLTQYTQNDAKIYDDKIPW